MLTAKEFANYILKKEDIKDCLVKPTNGIGSKSRPRFFKGGMKIYLKELDKTDCESFYVAAHEAAHVINIKNNESFFNKYWLMRNFLIFFVTTYLLLTLENILFGLPFFNVIKPFLVASVCILFFTTSRFYIPDERNADRTAAKIMKKHLSGALFEYQDHRTPGELFDDIDGFIEKKDSSIIRISRLMGYVIPAALLIELLPR